MNTLRDGCSSRLLLFGRLTSSERFAVMADKTAKPETWTPSLVSIRFSCYTSSCANLWPFARKLSIFLVASFFQFGNQVFLVAGRWGCGGSPTCRRNASKRGSERSESKSGSIPKNAMAETSECSS